MIEIRRADLDAPELAAFLQAHLDAMAPTAPPESRHALDLDGLRGPGVRVWSAHEPASGLLVGTIALATLGELGHDGAHEELKSMRTDPARRGQGIARLMLAHALADARSRGVTRVSLETGSMDFFVPARTFYTRAGFVPCAPFGRYVEDPNSAFMTLAL